MNHPDAYTQAFFSVYHYNLAKFVSRPPPIPPANIAAFRRVMQTGLTGLPEAGPYDDETLDFDHPGSPEELTTALAFDDPRAVDFRLYLRTW